MMSQHDVHDIVGRSKAITLELMRAVFKKVAVVLRLSEVFFQKTCDEVVYSVSILLIKFAGEDLQKAVVGKFLDVKFKGVDIIFQAPAIHAGAPVLINKSVAVFAHLWGNLLIVATAVFFRGD